MRKYLAQRRTTKQVKRLLENYPDRVMLNVGCGTDYKADKIQKSCHTALRNHETRGGIFLIVEAEK